MVRTRSSRPSTSSSPRNVDQKQQQKQQHHAPVRVSKTRKKNQPPEESESEDEQEVIEPKPISSEESSSEEESSDGDESSSTTSTSTSSIAISSSKQLAMASTVTATVTAAPSSRLFAPYRTLGVITSGRPYYVSNQGASSKTAFCTLPIGNQFHILQCDRLQPAMVSRVCPGTIQHIVSDASMGITVAAFGLQGNSNSNQLALYARTRIIDTRKVASSKLWNIVDMLHLGKTKIQMDGEKEGKYENAVIVAVVLSKDSLLSNTHSSSNNSSSVSVVGDNNEQDSSDDESSDDDDHNDHSSACVGQVVIMLATRTSLVIQKRIPLPPNFLPRVALHPSTYLNKIVLGGSTATSSLSTPSSSPLLLLNISTGKLIHVFSCLPAVARGGNYSITSLEQSPAVDTVAAGTSHGKVHLINLRHDLKLFTLHHYQSNNNKVGPCITSLSFRTDGSAMRYGIAPLAVGRSDGTVSIWDLTPPSKDDDDDDNDGTEDGGRRLLCDMPHLHAGGVAKLTYLPQEPLLLSTGSRSNSIQMHIFDNPDHTGRMLRHRSGHTSPPTCIRYTFPSNGSLLPSAMDGTDAASCQILSGGGTDRTLRMFSSARSILDKELSQGKGLEKKAKQLGLSSKDELLLPPITGMTTSEARKRDWGDLVTIHRNSAFAYVWNSQKGSQSGPILRQTKWNVSAMAQKKPPESVHATCIAMSACGLFL